MLKYATTEVLSASIGLMPQQPKTAHVVHFDYTPRAGYLYVRCRAISSRCNDNWDAFSPEAIEGDHRTTGYATFRGKPVFVNHDNADHRKLRGVAIDAALHRDRNPDKSPDTWAEVLMEIDAKTFPQLAKAVISGRIDRTSMGVDVARSTCSACGNVATKPQEYCEHIPKKKGKKLWSLTKEGTRHATLIFERCDGLVFFENSLLVEEPADPTAVTWGVDTRGLNAIGKLRHTAMQDPQVSPGNPVDPSIFENERMFLPRMPDLYPLNSHTASTLQFIRGGVCVACDSFQTIASGATQECFDCGAVHHVARQVIDPEVLLGTNFEVEGVRYQNPEDHPWFQAHPVHYGNILAHWNQATADEKDQGERWYSDAHLVAKGIAGGDVTKGAGMLAVYSPQTPWVSNIHNAARVLHENRARGGKGDGIMASELQKKQAQRILDGEHYNNVFTGPKIRDFAHLIDHGGDEHSEQPHVVIDRHALGVAHGKNISAEDYTAAPLGRTVRKDGTENRANYNHVVDQYHKAAQQISEKEGRSIAGHQVQAVTWLVRQRLNQKAERERATEGVNSRLDRGRERSRQKSETKWNAWRTENLPHFDSPSPGTGYQAKLAYGETKAPPDVDTLREEECPVCGESSNAWDGNRCSVCGFSAPPRQFRDPDLEMARQVDLRKQVVDPTGTYQTDVSDFADESQGTGDTVQDNDVEPDLVCDVCGTTFEAGSPQTTTTEPQLEPGAADPVEQQPEPGAEAAGPAEGDLCPDCGEGELVPPAMLDGPAEPDAVQPDSGGTVDPSQFDDESDSEPDEGDEKKDRKRSPAKGKGSPFSKK